VRVEFEALSEAAATGLIFVAGAGGSLALVLTLTVHAARRTERGQARRVRGKVTAGDGAVPGDDGFPPQPYSAAEPRSHQPFSQHYRVPRQDAAHNPTNGKRPSGSTGVPTAPWPPAED
jgi:hypothetical protein